MEKQMDEVMDLEAQDTEYFWNRAKDMVWTRVGGWEGQNPEVAEKWRKVFKDLVDVIEAEQTEADGEKNWPSTEFLLDHLIRLNSNSGE